MNSSPDEHEYQTTEASPMTDAFLPLTLLAVSFLVLFIWQLMNVSNQRAAIQNTLSRQEEVVKQSQQVQANLEKLVIDVLELRRAGDADAEALVQKYGIQQNAPSQIPLR